uniref:Uncharacterized protein n=1 Tax=Octopus bimaculoides TaxID=37653 RepID=A0A0L8IBY8_OCTBM
MRWSRNGHTNVALITLPIFNRTILDPSCTTKRLAISHYITPLFTVKMMFHMRSAYRNQTMFEFRSQGIDELLGVLLVLIISGCVIFAALSIINLKLKRSNGKYIGRSINALFQVQRTV